MTCLTEEEEEEAISVKDNKVIKALEEFDFMGCPNLVEKSLNYIYWRLILDKFTN